MTIVRQTASAVASLLLIAGTAFAQDLQNWCRDDALARCGDPSLSLATCMDDFDLWPVVPNECIGDLQTMIEMDREFEQQESGIVFGFSFGGILYDGPGREYGELGGLVGGDWLDLMEDTEISLDGYKWFLVDTPIGTGYHWGGNFCTEGEEAVEGVFGTCDQLAMAEETFGLLWDEASLSLDPALLVEGPATGFGLYIPRRDQTYAQGETIYIYAEPRAFGYGQRGRLHTIDLLFDLALFDDSGDILFEQEEFGAVSFQSHRRNKEIMFNADISADLPPGDYSLGIVARDQNKDGTDGFELPFTIAAQ